MIDEQECLDILDQIRVALPDEIKQARRVHSERDTIIAEAESRAQEVLREAEEQAAMQVQEHTLVRQAEQRAEQIQLDAERRSEEIRRDADEYAYEALSELESELEQLLLTVRKGTRALKPADGPRLSRRSSGGG
jgi:vacuolar-type H+-ATPase subunit H